MFIGGTSATFLTQLKTIKTGHRPHFWNADRITARDRPVPRIPKDTLMPWMPKWSRFWRMWAISRPDGNWTYYTGRKTLGKKQIHANEFIWEPASRTFKGNKLKWRVIAVFWRRCRQARSFLKKTWRGIAGVSGSKMNKTWMFYEHVFKWRGIQEMLIQCCLERKAWSTQTKTFIKKHSVWPSIQWKAQQVESFVGKVHG